MKTSVIEVRDMLSVLSVLGVEKRIGEVPGVESVTVNYAAGSATVRYDETRLNITDIKSDVRQSGYESGAPVASPVGSGHEGHSAPGGVSPANTAPASPAPASPKSAAVVPPSAAPAGNRQRDKAEQGMTALTTPSGRPKISEAAVPASTASKSDPKAAAIAGHDHPDNAAPEKS